MPTVTIATEAQLSVAIATHRTKVKAIEARAVAKAWPRRPIPERYLLNPAEVREYVARAAELLSLGTPDVEFHRLSSGSSHDVQRGSVCFARRSVPAHTIAHEVAHLMTGSGHHSTIWWGVYIALARELVPVYGRSLGAACVFFQQEVTPWES